MVEIIETKTEKQKWKYQETKQRLDPEIRCRAMNGTEFRHIYNYIRKMHKI